MTYPVQFMGCCAENHKRVTRVKEHMNTRARFLIVLTFCLLLFPVHAEEVQHTVRKGETLYSISRNYNVPVSAVREANDIEDARDLSLGAELIIPSVYVAEKGDTYYSIARDYDMSVDELLDLNDLSGSSVLKIGDTLYVPSSNGSAEQDTEETDSREDKLGQDVADSPSDSELPSIDDVTRLAEPETVSVGDGSRSWPHPGSRDPMEGKLPGVTISGTVGDDVVSISSGRVIYAGPYTTFGRVAIVQSATGYIYVYGGNRELDVSVGELVQPGTPIGELGESPNGEASRLYFSVWKNDSFVDPSRAPRS